MSDEAGIVRVPAAIIEALDTEALCTVGMRPDDAGQVAQSLVHADLTGVFTHGSNFLPLYANWIQVGSIDPTAAPEVVSDSGATAIISARNAMGQVAGVQAMDLAIKKAKQFGIGAVGVRESNHFGAAAYYTMRALDHDAIGFASTNGIQVMAPYGGVTPSLSNTPIAYAIPAATERPLMLDMAVSVVAAGKVALAKRKGQSIPPQLGFDWLPANRQRTPAWPRSWRRWAAPKATAWPWCSTRSAACSRARSSAKTCAGAAFPIRHRPWATSSWRWTSPT